MADDNAKSYSILLTVFIVIVFLFMIAVIIYIVVRSPGTSSYSGDEGPGVIPPVSPSPPIGFMYECSADKPCADGLECDINTSTCLVPENGRCTQASDCVTGLYCSGYCYNSETTPPSLLTGETIGAIGYPCPCYNPFLTKLECVASNALDRDPFAKACYVKAGWDCSFNSDCSSGSCVDGICQTGLQNGDPCTVNSQCTFNNCSNGLCQPPGTTTGEVNAVCKGTQDCNPDLICSLSGTCQSPDSGLLLACGGVVTCPGLLGCYQIPSQDENGEYPPPGTSQGFGFCSSDTLGNCACLFNTNTTTAIPEPNRALNNQCSSGYSSNLNADCVGGLGEPCYFGNNCASGSCTGAGKVYVYQPKVFEDGCYPALGVAGVTDGQWLALGTISDVSKLTGTTLNYSPPTILDGELLCSTTNLGNDTLYALTPSGVYKLDFSTNIWNLFLGPSFSDNTGTYTLIDVEVLSEGAEELILVGYRDSSGRSILYSADAKGNLTPYNGGTQLSTGNTINFTSISTANLNGINILLQAPGGLYFKSGASIGYSNVSSYVPVGATSAKLFNAVGKVSGENTAYLAISYITPSGSGTGYRKVAFSRSLTNNLTGTTGITLPTNLYGANVDESVVQSYSFSNVNPLTSRISNGAMVASIAAGTSSLFYVNFLESSMTAIPGYVNSSNQLLVTTANLYLYSPSSCI